MNRINQNIEAATKAIRLLLENHQCGDLPGRVSENGVKTRVANRDLLSDGETLNRIDIKTNIHGEAWELDSRMERLNATSRTSATAGTTEWKSKSATPDPSPPTKRATGPSSGLACRD